MDSFNQRFQKDFSFVSHEVAGELILVPVCQSVGELENIYTLNETAACAWTLFDGQHTLAEIHQEILAEYKVDEDQARQDLLELVEQLQQIGAIVNV